MLILVLSNRPLQFFPSLGECCTSFLDQERPGFGVGKRRELRERYGGDEQLDQHLIHVCRHLLPTGAPVAHAAPVFDESSRRAGRGRRRFRLIDHGRFVLSGLSLPRLLRGQHLA